MKILVQYKINCIEKVSNMSFRYEIEIDEKDEIKNDIGDRKEEKAHSVSVGPRRSHEALREIIKFVPAVEVGPNEI